MPTGIALRDVREQLFAAAERVLLSAGPNALTSRAVTAEAGCAKGVLHRHFPDFDAFLTDFVRERIAGINRLAAELRETAGTGRIGDRLAETLTDLFDPVTLAMIGLVIARDELRARLRRAGSPGIPLLAEATVMIADYLAAERDAGRLAPGADVDTLAAMLVGTGHLIFAGRNGTPPDPAVVHKAVATTISAALRPDGPAT